jgi:hypothetical protein
LTFCRLNSRLAVDLALELLTGDHPSIADPLLVALQHSPVTAEILEALAVLLQEASTILPTTFLPGYLIQAITQCNKTLDTNIQVFICML